MKGVLLAINHSCVFFGATLYCGVLWAMHFFWFPTWQHLTVDNYYYHFVPETLAATAFFTVVVPIMFLCNLIALITEWKGGLRWPVIAAFLCLSTGTWIGQMYIIPVNKIIDAGVHDQAQLSSLLQRWMSLNDMRWIALTIMWLAMMYYFIAKAKLTRVLEEGPVA